MRLSAFVPTTNPGTQLDGGAETGTPRLEFFQTQCAVAKPVLVCQLMQPFNGGMAAGVQPEQRWLGGEIDVF